MASRKPLYFFISLLLFIGFTQIYHRHVTFETPWLPGEKRQIWNIEAKLSFDAMNKPVKAILSTPQTQPGFTLLSKNATSQGYGLNYVEPEVGQVDTSASAKTIWSKRRANGLQELYYKTEFLVDPKADYQIPPSTPRPKSLELDEPYQTAVAQIINQAYELSSGPLSLTREVLKQFVTYKSQNIRLLKDCGIKRAELIVGILNQAKVKARLVKGLYLEDGRRNQNLKPFIQVFADNGKVTLFNPFTGKQGQANNLLLWENNGQATIELTGGKKSSVHFSMLRTEQATQRALASKRAHSNLLNFSIDSLPLKEQSLFKGILLIPIGVLVVVLLRILVGIKTSGTFMPVLIAMAFIQTSLLTGITGFVLVVGVGLIIRSWLSRLNLLLVSRISAVIITVIGIIALFSVISFKMGLSEGLKITFFPMIILAWTIERMSILWEEEGAKEVLVQGGGSLITAIIAFLAMSNEVLRHLSFNFLGLQLILLAIILMLGNYTGYRLLELRRFKPLAHLEKDKE